MKRPTILFFLLVFYTCTLAQKGVNKKDMVGFGCYKGEKQTQSVSKALLLLNKSDYQGLAEMLDSKKRSERYIAVVLLEWLESDSAITIEEKQRQKIKTIYESNQKVSFCSGCIYWEKMSFREALNIDSKPRRLFNKSLERFLN